MDIICILSVLFFSVFQFLRDELKYEDGFERHSSFHGNDDLITISDLWHHWIRSTGNTWNMLSSFRNAISAPL